VCVSLKDCGEYHEGHGPIGLLFSQAEFDEAVLRFRGIDGRIRLDDELQEMIFDWTEGHAGAVHDVLQRLSWQV
jgi:hypothetical protein